MESKVEPGMFGSYSTPFIGGDADHIDQAALTKQAEWTLVRFPEHGPHPPSKLALLHQMVNHPGIPIVPGYLRCLGQDYLSNSMEVFDAFSLATLLGTG